MPDWFPGKDVSLLILYRAVPCDGRFAVLIRPEEMGRGLKLIIDIDPVRAMTSRFLSVIWSIFSVWPRLFG